MRRENRRIAFAFLLLIFSFCQFSWSQVDTFSVMMERDSMPFDNIPVLEIMPLPGEQKQHPYLFFSKDNIDGLKVRANHPELYHKWQAIKKSALDLESERFSFADAILPGCFAYQITGEKKYADAALVKLERLFDIPYPWTIPEKDAHDVKHLNWDVADKALAIAYAFDMLYDVMTEEQKKQCLDALKSKVFPQFMAAHSRYYEQKKMFTDQYGHSDWWTNCYFTWNSRLNGAIGLAALATLWEISDAPKVLYQARKSLQYTHPEFDQGETESGGYDEGPMAAFLHAGNLIRFYTALQNVMENDDGFFDLPGLKMLPEFIMAFVGPDEKYVPFGASYHRKVIDPSSELYYLAKIFENRKFSNFIDKHGHPDNPMPFAILYRPLYNDTLLFETKSDLQCFNDIHWGYINNYRFFIPFKGGDNAANLSKLDAGNLLLYLNDEPLLFAPMMFKPKSDKYNCLIINGVNQIEPDPGYRNFGGHSPAMGEIIECRKTNESYHVVLDLTSCYEGVKRYHRHIILADIGVVLVFDEVKTNEIADFQLNWHTKRKLTAENDSVFSIVGEHRGVNVEFESNTSWETYILEKHSKKNLQLSTKNASDSIKIITMFSPLAFRQFNLDAEFSENMLVLKVSVRNKTKEYILFFEEGRYKLIRDYRSN